ncbi:unnamed protein product [Symbiodinium sp. CCMP2592]|nr:unnamed protein product [Symbiodinium sp. CCMP2592]
MDSLTDEQREYLATLNRRGPARLRDASRSRSRDRRAIASSTDERSRPWRAPSPLLVQGPPALAEQVRLLQSSIEIIERRLTNLNIGQTQLLMVLGHHPDFGVPFGAIAEFVDTMKATVQDIKASIEDLRANSAEQCMLLSSRLDRLEELVQARTSGPMVNFRRRWSLQASRASEDARSRSPSVRIAEAAERADSFFEEHSPLLSEDARSWSPSFFNAALCAGSPLGDLADSNHGLDPAPERSSGSDGWERVGSALPQDPGPVLSSEVQRAVVYQRDVSLPKLPYEHGIWGLVFGSPASLPTARFPAPVGPRPQPIPTPPDPSTNSLELSAAAPPDVSLARIKAATFRVTDAALRDRCLVQLKTLLLLDPSATKTGIQMTTCFGKILEPDRALLVLQDTLRPKATGTISKRTGSLWRLAHYLASVDGRSPFMVSEPLLYEYLCSLREAETGATSGASALEALRFADGLFRFQRISLREVDSARIRGVAHAMYVRKQKRQQAPALTVRAIRFLMAWCCDPSRPLHTRVISGHLLACIFAVARWSDLRFLAFFRVLSDDEFSIFESATSQHKTAHSKEAQVELLPFIGLGQWPGCESWAACLETLRAESDLSHLEGRGG